MGIHFGVDCRIHTLIRNQKAKTKIVGNAQLSLWKFMLCYNKKWPFIRWEKSQFFVEWSYTVLRDSFNSSNNLSHQDYQYVLENAESLTCFGVRCPCISSSWLDIYANYVYWKSQVLKLEICNMLLLLGELSEQLLNDPNSCITQPCFHILEV